MLSLPSLPRNVAMRNAHEHQDEQDHHDQSQPAARTIAPASTVRPRGKRTQTLKIRLQQNCT